MNQTNDQIFHNFNRIVNYYSFNSNFSNYKSRFTMPSFEGMENMFYSWNLGLVHFIAINTEAYYYLNYGIKPLILQYLWLVNDLKVSMKSLAKLSFLLNLSLNHAKFLEVPKKVDCVIIAIYKHCGCHISILRTVEIH